MDKKAWFVVIACIALMGVNWHYMQQNAEMQRKLAAEKKALEEAQAKANPATAGSTGQAATITPAAQPAPAAPEQKHAIESGSTTFEFTSRGGGLATASLKAGDQIVLNRLGKESIGALRREATGSDSLAYTIVEKSDRQVIFEATSAEGLKVRKEYRLKDGEGGDEHLLTLAVTLTNTGTVQHKSEEYYLYAGAAHALEPGETPQPAFFWNDSGDADYEWVGWFAGGMFSSEKNEFRQSLSKLRWGGVMNRFYVHILSTKDGVEEPGKIWASRFKVDHTGDAFANTSAGNNDYAVQSAVGLPVIDLASGQSKTVEYEIYTGPKEYSRLAGIGRQRQEAMFYGFFSLISIGLSIIMRWMHDFTGNWGIAIIMLTIVVRTILWYPQSRAQYSMKRMGLLAPKMKELQEKYKDDQQRQSQEMMKLYRDYGVNPLGGCLPLLIQIPIFFGFFSVLQYAAELRGQPFLWVKDLSMPDTLFHIAGFPINPLPLLMGITMVLQMKMTPQPATMDKTQAFIMKFMPLIFLFFCYNFASALALYWTTQNIYSIIQTQVMKLYQKEPTLEKVQRAPKAAPAPSNPFTAQHEQKREERRKNRPPKLGG
jgi:YidC/Oxa1 family membrane protein insertase